MSLIDVCPSGLGVRAAGATAGNVRLTSNTVPAASNRRPRAITKITTLTIANNSETRLT